MSKPAPSGTPWPTTVRKPTSSHARRTSSAIACAPRDRSMVGISRTGPHQSGIVRGDLLLLDDRDPETRTGVVSLRVEDRHLQPVAAVGQLRRVEPAREVVDEPRRPPGPV